MEQITLNLIPGGIPQICNVSQYDDGRVIRLHLKNGLSNYTLSGTETISLLVSKRDQTTYECAVTNTSSSYVDITTVPEMCDVSGESECELTISSENTVLGTGNFRMMVDPDAFDGDLKVKSVSGPIATFETDLAEDIIKLDVDLEPIQDLHGYDGAWSAGGWKNIAHFNTDNLDNSQQCTVTYIDDNNLSINVMGNYARAMYAIMCPENTTVTVSFKGSSTANYRKVQISSVNSWSGISWYRIFNLTEQEAIYSYTFTTTAGSTIIYVGFYVTAGANTGVMHIKDFQIEKGSTATSFAPYSNVCPITGHTSAVLNRAGSDMIPTDPTPITVNFGQIIYKGKLDTKNSKVILTSKGLKIEDGQWSYMSQYKYFQNTVSDIEKNTSATQVLEGLMCEVYTNRTPQQAGSGNINGSIAALNDGIRIKDLVYDNTTDFVNAMGDYRIVYPLAEPIEIPLSAISPIPALVGTNNVYSDAGDVEVEYYTTK